MNTRLPIYALKYICDTSAKHTKCVLIRFNPCVIHSFRNTSAALRVAISFIHKICQKFMFFHFALYRLSLKFIHLFVRALVGRTRAAV